MDYVFLLLRVVLEHLDFMNVLEMPSGTFSHFKQLEHDYIGYQSLTDVPRVLHCEEELQDMSVKIIVAFDIS